MACQMATTAVTLNDLEGYSPVAGLFKCSLSNVCIYSSLFTRKLVALRNKHKTYEAIAIARKIEHKSTEHGAENTRSAAFYTISTDSVLARFLCVSKSSCDCWS